MKLLTARINGYKSFNDESITDISNINMIYGHNNSGKSNLLKFIQLIFESKFPTSSKTRIDESRMGKVADLSAEQSADFWDGIIINQPYIFRNGREKLIKYDIELSENPALFDDVLQIETVKKVFKLTEEEITVKIAGQIKPSGDYDASISLTGVWINGNELFLKNDDDRYFHNVQGLDGNNLRESGYEILIALLGKFNNSVLLLDNDRYFGEEKESNIIGELTPKNFKNWCHNASLSPAKSKELKRILVEVSKYHPNGDASFTHNEMSSPIKPGLSFEFARILNNIDLFLENRNNVTLPLSSFGTGIQQILYILSKVAEKKPKIVLIEEIELNLSPKYQYELLQHFLLKYIEIPAENLKQIFFTTHTPMLCFRDDFQIYRIKMNRTGESKIERVGDRKELKEFYPEETIKQLLEQK
jgi:predicted ATP-dependent endonuclease of OLD family